LLTAPGSPSAPPRPQELCTLLRAAHLDICEPQPFLAKLARIVQTMPWIVRNWSTSELNELSRALGLLQPSLMMQQQQAQQQQQQQQQQAKAQQQQAAAAALLGLSGPGLEALLVQGECRHLLTLSVVLATAFRGCAWYPLLGRACLRTLRQAFALGCMARCRRQHRSYAPQPPFPLWQLRYSAPSRRTPLP
jgi:hypothetical protein